MAKKRNQEHSSWRLMFCKKESCHSVLFLETYSCHCTEMVKVARGQEQEGGRKREGEECAGCPGFLVQLQCLRGAP